MKKQEPVKRRISEGTPVPKKISKVEGSNSKPVEKSVQSKVLKASTSQISVQPLDLSCSGPSGVTKVKSKKETGKVADTAKKPSSKRPASNMASEPVKAEESPAPKIAKLEKNDVGILHTYTEIF